MKQKRVERVERRRPLLEFDLQADAKKRSPKGRRGCALPFLSGLLLALSTSAILIAIH